MAWSLGRLASNNSATLGKPPVISLVFAPSLGILAITSPALILSPSSTDKIASTDIECLSGFPFSLFNGAPFSRSTIIISGLSSFPLGADLQSETILWAIPVASSVSSLRDTPATKSINFAIPLFSAIIGNV